MIISSHQWRVLWEAITDDFPGSTEKGLSVIFSLQEVETVCAVKMLLVRPRADAAENHAVCLHPSTSLALSNPCFCS